MYIPFIIVYYPLADYKRPFHNSLCEVSIRKYWTKKRSVFYIHEAFEESLDDIMAHSVSYKIVSIK